MSNLRVNDNTEIIRLKVEDLRVVEAVSPTAEIERTEDGVIITIKDIHGEHTQTLNDGVTPNLTAGTIEMLPADSEPRIEISGEKEAPVLSFWIPRGLTGETGNGISSII